MILPRTYTPPLRPLAWQPVVRKILTDGRDSEVDFDGQKSDEGFVVFPVHEEDMAIVAEK